jgi:hypothetical protein
MATQKAASNKSSTGKAAKSTKAKGEPSKLASLKNFLMGSSKKKADSKGASNSKKGAPAPAKAQVQKKVEAAAPQAKKAAKGKGADSTAKRGTGQKEPRMMSSTMRLSIELNSQGEAVCREIACEGLATSSGYCRLHYIKNWKKIKRKELILREKKLNQYIEELVAKYPDKYIEAIRQDLANDKDFAKVIHDLDLDESVDDFDVESESMDVLIDNIKRDFEDEGEGF